MTAGTGHYAQAETLADMAEMVAIARDGKLTPEMAAALAQVKATLALAAATALQHYNYETGMCQDDRAAWLAAASEYPAAQAARRQRDREELAEFGTDRP